MQPTSGPTQYPSQPGRPDFAPEPAEAELVRVRPWLTGGAAAIALLVLIAGISNQGVTDQITKHHLSTTKFFDDVAYSTTTFAWRFGPQFDRDFGHLWLAGLIFDVLAIVLTLVLTAALVKNKRGFGGAFLSAWVAVFVAVQLSAYVRASIVDVNLLQQQKLGKAVTIFFSQYSAGQFSLLAGLLYGLVTALVAAAIATATRRTEVLAAPSAAYPPPGAVEEQQPRRENQQPWTAPPPPGPASSPSPWTDRNRVDTTKRGDAGPQETAVLPAVDEQGPRRHDFDAQATTQLPVHRGDGEPEATQGYPVPREDEPEATQAYRVPREDEGRA